MREALTPRNEAARTHEVDGIRTGVVEFPDESAMVACYTLGDVVRIGSLPDGQHGDLGYPHRYSVNADLPVSRAAADDMVGRRGRESSFDHNYYRAIMIGGHRADGRPVFVVMDGEYVTAWTRTGRGNEVLGEAHRVTREDRRNFIMPITIGQPHSRWDGLVVDWVGRPFSPVGAHRDGAVRADIENPLQDAVKVRNALRKSGVNI
ncbi:MAG: hypothetical protein Q4A37_03405 [Candidatus Saccharibacteria bacterium]|nr:hypothetical protein [Candidatus Saccharibacteria bacterium]